MKLNKITIMLLVTVLVATCLMLLCGCANATASTNDIPQQDGASERVSFGKKYYSLTSVDYDKNQYYQFNEDGTGICNITLEENGKVTYRSVINFKWIYAGEGNFVLLHNGTQMITGKQDDVFGFGRTMRTTKCAMYWDDMYYVCEDCVNAIPNYAQFVGNK